MSNVEDTFRTIHVKGSNANYIGDEGIMREVFPKRKLVLYSKKIKSAINNDFEEMVQARRLVLGRPEIDPDVIEVVRMINSHSDIVTTFSCSGHEEPKKFGYVVITGPIPLLRNVYYALEKKNPRGIKSAGFSHAAIYTPDVKGSQKIYALTVVFHGLGHGKGPEESLKEFLEILDDLDRKSSNLFL